ncbi:MAG: DUF4367 domain-containing protein [Oscillospiraceae bacterium]|nr:DUF4367 domain-containing protein [Oscillospiraceae bacterium]
MDQNNKNQLLLDEYNEDMITHAAKLLELEEQAEAERLFDEFEAMPDPKYSDEFKLNMDKLLHGDNDAKKTGRKGTVRSFRKRIISAAACILGVFIIGGGLLTVSSDAYLEHLKYLIGKTFSTHTTFDAETAIPERFKQQLIDSGWDNVLYPTYLPRGFELMEITSNKVRYRIEFSDASKNFTMNISTSGDNSAYIFDTISSDTKEIDINGIKATFIEKEQDKSLIFLMNEKIVLISSKSLSKNQIKGIAENIQQIELKS